MVRRSRRGGGVTLYIPLFDISVTWKRYWACVHIVVGRRSGGGGVSGAGTLWGDKAWGGGGGQPLFVINGLPLKALFAQSVPAPLGGVGSHDKNDRHFGDVTVIVARTTSARKGGIKNVLLSDRMNGIEVASSPSISESVSHHSFRVNTPHEAPICVMNYFSFAFTSNLMKVSAINFIWATKC